MVYLRLILKELLSEPVGNGGRTGDGVMGRYGEELMKKKKRPFLLAYKAEEALRKAVAEAIAEHRRNGVPIAIWRNGKVVRIPAHQIEVQEPQVGYGVSRKKRT